MADTTTLAKGLTKPSIGAHPDTWGDVLNTNFDLIDAAFGGVTAVSISGDFTLSAAQAQSLTYEISGALTADATITFPPYRGIAYVRNLTTGGFHVICQMNTMGVSIPVDPGTDRAIVGDGVDFFSNVGAVARTGDTMTGTLTISTDPGTVGLQVTSGIVVGGAAAFGNNVDVEGALLSHGIALISGDSVNAGYTRLYDNSTGLSLMLGNASDQSNYYRQTTHYFQSRAGGTNFMYINSSGLVVQQGLTVQGSSGLSVSAGSLSVSANIAAGNQVSGNTVVAQAGGYSLSTNGHVLANGIVQAQGNNTNALYAPAGGVTVGGNVYCSGSGITFQNIGPDGFNFRWDGTHILGRVDNSVEYPLMRADSDTMSGNLAVNNQISANSIVANGITSNGGIVAGSSMNCNTLNVSGGASLAGGQVSVDSNGIHYFGDGNTFAFQWAGYAQLFVDRGYQGTVVVGNGGSDTISYVQANTVGFGIGWAFDSFGTDGTNFRVLVDAISDARFKEKIGDTKVDALAAILAVPVREFTWKKEHQDRYGDQPIRIGLVAQEVKEHIPEMVVVEEKPIGKGLLEDQHWIHLRGAVPYLMRAIQQLTARVIELEGKASVA